MHQDLVFQYYKVMLHQDLVFNGFHSDYNRKPVDLSNVSYSPLHTCASTIAMVWGSTQIIFMSKKFDWFAWQYIHEDI